VVWTNTKIFWDLAWCHIPEDFNLHQHSYHLKSCEVWMVGKITITEWYEQI